MMTKQTNETHKVVGRGARRGEPRVQRLWLVRHGVTQWNIDKRICGWHDAELAETGREQAQRVAQRLCHEHITSIYSSDLARARDTAEIIAQRCGKAGQVQISPAWREMFFGDWEGLTYAQVVERYEQERAKFFTHPFEQSPPNGEAFGELVQRVQSAFRDLVASTAQTLDQAEAGGDIVLVSHGGALRVLLCSMMGMPFERQWQWRIDHGSLSAIDFIAGTEDPFATASLALFNERASLQSSATGGL